MGIVLQGLGKTFQTTDLTVEALRDISVRVSDSEFVSIIGPSGCGKSTLLRLVSGLIPLKDRRGISASSSRRRRC